MDYGAAEPYAASRFSGGAPITERIACYIAIAEGIIGIAFGIFLVVRGVTGNQGDSIVTDQASRAVAAGYGTAVLFFIFFGAVLAAGVSLLRGGRWGRGLIIFFNLILLGCAWYIVTAGLITIAIVVALIAICALVFSFHPKTLEWAKATY